jgi:steroid delta-isomerase-like uncharacterized protein
MIRQLLAVAFILCAAPAAAAPPEPITNADLDRWQAAWNSRDIDTVLALFASDARIDQPENPKPLDLKAARGFFGMIFRAYPDFHIVVRRGIIEGMTAVSVEQVTGTWRGPFVDPASGKSTPRNGRHFDHPGVMVIDYAPDHRIEHLAIYWDQLIVDHQLGITPR